MIQVYLAEDFEIEYSLLFCNDGFSLLLESVDDNLQHYLTGWRRSSWNVIASD